VARRIIEVVIFAISAIAIVLVVGVLGVEALDERRPADPSVTVHLEAAREGALGWIVPMTVTNGGDQTVEEAVLEATATVDGTQEMSEITVLLLPSGSDVEVEIGFSGRPVGPIEVRLVGQLLP